MLTSLTIRLKKYSAALLISAAFTLLWFNSGIEAESRFTKYKLSSSTSSFSTSSGTYVDVTNATVTIKTTGRPVVIELIPANATTADIVQYSGSATHVNIAEFLLDRSGTSKAYWAMEERSNGTAAQYQHPCSVIRFVDVPAAGSYTYKIQVKQTSGAAGYVAVQDCQLLAYELP